MSRREIELLAPGGDIDCIKAAIAAGANAIYCGLDKFNARNRAANITFDHLHGIVRLAHNNNCQIFITLNIIIVDSEIPALIGLLNRLVNTDIDGVIIQDLGMFYLLNKYFPTLKIHASTQCTTHNSGQIKFLASLNSTRVNLSRELNISEIKELTSVAHSSNVLTEVFVHGSNCISFSGICYMSSVQSGNSGNRGRCSQPCRDGYLTTPEGKTFPLNLKDNSAYFNLYELNNAGVDSLKIEGRIKSFDYVYTIVNEWNKHLQNLYNAVELSADNSVFYKVFNRDFTNSFLKGDISKDMFIDNPRDHSIKRLSIINDYAKEGDKDKDQENLFLEKDKLREIAQFQIDKLSVEKVPITIAFSGNKGEPLKVLVTTPNDEFEVCSELNLENIGKQTLDKEILLTRFKALNETQYFINDFIIDSSLKNLFIPFKELTQIKSRLLFILNGNREAIAPIEVPSLKRNSYTEIKPTLSVLISSVSDVHLCELSSAEIFFQIPNIVTPNLSQLITLFAENPKLVPWFPSVLIGDNFDSAVQLLAKIKPIKIVSDNTGIAYYAFKNGINWIAGPQLNIVNSYSILCLKEQFNCSGAFISNEISKVQIKGIKKPDNFQLFYSIYHPIVLMTSRQCLFHQVTGCHKNVMDNHCLTNCKKSATITSLKENTIFIDKQKGFYHNLYNQYNYLNTDVVFDFNNVFDNFFIDLRDIKTNTVTCFEKPDIINVFENIIDGDTQSLSNVSDVIVNTTQAQYKKGI